MRSEDLIALAAAQGVDLQQAAKLASKVKPKRDVQRQKFANGRSAMVLAEPIANAARGRETRTNERPEWTLAELGQASAGVPKIPFAAACYAFAGDRSQYWALHNALCDRATHLANDYRWPEEVVDLHGIAKPYLRHLSLMVLDEDQHPHLFRLLDQVLFPIYMGTSAKVWEKQLHKRYLLVKDIWGQWLQTALSMIQANLSGRHE